MKQTLTLIAAALLAAGAQAAITAEEAKALGTTLTPVGAVKAATLNEGRSMDGAHAGFPFPIPRTGNEAMWNHLVRFNGQAYEAKYRNLSVDASGRTTLAVEALGVQEYPFWDASKTSADT